MRSKPLLALVVVCLVLKTGPAAAHRHLRHSHGAQTSSAQPGNRGVGRILSGFRGLGGALSVLGPDTLQALLANNPGIATSWQELAQRLDSDDDVGVDPQELLLLAQCRGLVTDGQLPEGAALVSSATALPGTPPPASGADPPPDQAFNLSSRPASAAKVYLDFTGPVFPNGTTKFHTNAGVTVDIVIPPFDRDGVPGSFSAAERADIVTMWQGVAEDFAMLDVDVTTKQPPGLGTSAATNIQHVAIGGDSKWTGMSLGGWTFIGSFGKGPAWPAFVFPLGLSNFNKYIFEATSHEIGHALGLSHDGTTTITTNNTYYSGAGDWAPIMGYAYTKQITQWSKGEYPNANNPEDDLAIMSNVALGRPALLTPPNSDIYSALAFTETAPGSATAVDIVAKAGSPVVFELWASAAGTITVSVAVRSGFLGTNGVYYGRSDLDLSVTILDRTNATVAPSPFNPPGADPTNGLGIASASVAVAVPDLYYVAVAGAGAGDVLAGGYSDYASLGQFQVSVTYPVDPSVPLSSRPAKPVRPGPPPPPPNPPPPVPNPPPPPPPGMRVTISGLTATKAPSTKVTCSATVLVEALATNGSPAGALSGAIVAGTWTYSTTTSSDTASCTTSSSSGQCSLSSGASNVRAPVTCTFTVASVTRSGYVLNTAASAMTRSLTTT